MLHGHARSVGDYVGSLQRRLSALGAARPVVSAHGLVVGQCGDDLVSGHLWFSGHGDTGLVGQLRDIRIGGELWDGQRAADELLRRWRLDRDNCFEGVIGDFAIVIGDRAGKTAHFARSAL